MAKKKKSRSSSSSPISHASQQSDVAPGGLNPTSGGCSGNASFQEEGRKMEEDKEEKKEEKMTSFPSPLDLPPPPVADGKPKVEEIWWRGEGEESKCVQAWSIWSGLTKKANLYLATGETIVVSAEEWAAGQSRAMAVMS